VSKKLDPTAVKAADKALYAKHPELQGRKITSSQQDAVLRKEWLGFYNQAENKPKPPSPNVTPKVTPTPPAPTDGSLLMCVYTPPPTLPTQNQETPSTPKNETKVHVLGSLSSSFEGNGEPGLVSTGKGDYGGASYGPWQLSSTQGRPEAFLKSKGSAWASRFKGLKSGTPEFTRVWKEIAKESPDDFLELNGSISKSHIMIT
jgi:hypothetical protein